jgi:hypothetical protein
MTLESSYRRLTSLFPADWRAEHEEELLGTLLDMAGTDRRRASVAEAGDLIRAALAVRARRRRQPALGTARLAAGVVGVIAVLIVAGASLADVSGDFLVASLVVALIPGTGVVYTISSAIGSGWRRGSFAAAGCTLGIVPHIVAAMLGLSGAMHAGAAAFEVVRWIGAGYLAFLGLSMLRAGDVLRLDPDLTDHPARSCTRRWIQRSLATLLVGSAARLAATNR